jgi:PAS domain S-box-containing protein
MNQPIENIRILMLEDVPSDAELEKIELQDAGLAFTSLRMDTREAFEQALDEFKPDIILADYRLPAYNGRDALEYTCRTHPQIPVIMVTGALGDQAAVELLKMGARDFVLKGSLARLAPAIKRALSEEISIRNRKRAEEKYLAVFNEAMDGIVLINCETWQVVDCNPEFEKQTGRTLAQLKEIKVWEILPPEQHELCRQTMLEIQKTGSGRGSNFTMQKPGSEIVPIEFSAKLLNIQQQSVIQSVTRDISERLRAEYALRDSENKFHSITASAQDAILMMDNEGKISYWNAAAEKIFGYPPQEALGQPLHELLASERYLDQYRKGFSHFKETGEGPVIGKTLELAALKKDGTEFPIELSLSAIKREGKWNSISIVRDITERKRTEVALLRANRALKTLSAGNLALVRAASEDELLREVTKVIVETGGYLLAVVDYAEDYLEKTITPIAWFGAEESRYWPENLSWADTEQGQLPISKAIRSGATQICRNIASDPAFKPWREAALARGYVSNIALPLSGGGRTFGGLSIYASEAEFYDDEEVLMLEELANDLAYGITTLRARVEHEQHATILRESLEQSIQTIAGTVEARDPYTAGHQRRVGELAVAIAQEMGLPEEQINGIHLAAIIHDLGKIHIPAEILSKPTKLTDIEYMLIKTHPQAGYDILKNVKFPWPIADIILQHHERLDGSGYPQGLKSEQILLESKIIGVADVVEAMLSHRPYRPALGSEAAMDEIKRGRGSAYDSVVVDICLTLLVDKGFQFSSDSIFN